MNLREASKVTFSANTAPTHEDIQSGSLQRIADACELMAKNHAALISERDYYKNRYDEHLNEIKRLGHVIRSLRGTITRMKRKEQS